MRKTVEVDRWVALIAGLFGVIGTYATIAIFPLRSTIDDVHAKAIMNSESIIRLQIQTDSICEDVHEHHMALGDLDELKVYMRAMILALDVKGETLERAKTDTVLSRLSTDDRKTDRDRRERVPRRDSGVAVDGE